MGERAVRFGYKDFLFRINNFFQFIEYPSQLVVRDLDGIGLWNKNLLKISQTFNSPFALVANLVVSRVLEDSFLNLDFRLQ